MSMKTFEARISKEMYNRMFNHSGIHFGWFCRPFTMQKVTW